MNKYFRLLGVKEDATTEDIQAAYSKWVAKYNAADYADDPDYVKRKLNNLNKAYKIALSQVGTSAAYDQDYDDGYDGDYERGYGREYGSNLDGKECMHFDEYDDESVHGSIKKAFSNAKAKAMAPRTQTNRMKDTKAGYDFKKKLDEIKKEVKKNVEGLSSFFESEDSNDGDIPYMSNESIDTYNSDSNEETGLYEHVDTGGYKLSDTGDGNVTAYRPEKKSGADNTKIAGTVVAIILALVSAGISMCDGNSDGDYQNDYTEQYTNERDVEIAQAGDEMYGMLDTYVGVEEEKSKIKNIKLEANRFAQRYFQMETIEEVEDYMKSEYDYYFMDDATYWQKLNNIMGWFNIPSYTMSLGCEYSGVPGGSINNKVEYLQFINDFYDNHGDEFTWTYETY